MKLSVIGRERIADYLARVVDSVGAAVGAAKGAQIEQGAIAKNEPVYLAIGRVGFPDDLAAIIDRPGRTIGPAGERA